MTVKMSFGAFWFHIDDEFFCGECLYSSGVLLIIITQLADNFDVISAACGGSSSSESRVSKRGNRHEENT